LPLKKAVRDLVKHHGYKLRSDVQLIQFSPECGMPDYSFDPGTGKSYTRGIRFPLFHRQLSPRFNGDASRSLLLAIYHLRLTFSLLCSTS
jgi:hypothetical protein